VSRGHPSFPSFLHPLPLSFFLWEYSIDRGRRELGSIGKLRKGRGNTDKKEVNSSVYGYGFRGYIPDENARIRSTLEFGGARVYTVRQLLLQNE